MASSTNHRLPLRWLLLLGSCQLLGCTPLKPPTETTTPLNVANLAPPSEATIATQTLTPRKIEVTIASLPAPKATKSASKPPQVVPIPQAPQLNVPAGFAVNVYADGLDAPRWLALTPSGEVLVTETRQNRIRILADRDENGTADFNQVFAAAAENGLNMPFGMAFAGGYFFLGNSAEVRRYHYSTHQQQLVGTGEKITELPGGGYNQHWTRNVIPDAKGEKLYVSIGSESNVAEEPAPRATVQVMNLDGSDRRTFASGLRNPVGLATHPETGELYTTVNERDGLGDDLVPDYFTRIQQDEFYGWPYAYLTPNLLDPRQTNQGQSRNPELAAQTKTPDVLFQAHSAALGLQFYTANRFPEKYRNGAFVAFRGSWNRDQGTGYKIVFIPFNPAVKPEEQRPLGYYEDFVTGFLTDPSGPYTWGRPVGLLVLPDGSLLFTEEANGRIYRVSYTPPARPKSPDAKASPILRN
jgi:glucose/arabinose dehydrogenase